jgi:hypothetical protein
MKDTTESHSTRREVLATSGIIVSGIVPLATITDPVAAEQKQDATKVEGFENGIPDYWQDVETATATTSRASSGEHSLKITDQGDDGMGNRIHCDSERIKPNRLRTTMLIDDGTWNSVITSWKGGDEANATVRLDNASWAGGTEGISFNGTMLQTVEPNVWYTIELASIDWENDTVGQISINGSVVAENLAPANLPGAGIDGTTLYVHDGGTGSEGYFDALTIGQQTETGTTSTPENTTTDRNGNDETTTDIEEATTSTLLNEDFENYATGSFPEPWTRSGNDNQNVVDDSAAHGERALRMVGDSGGCWLALAHRKLSGQIPSDETIVFSGQIRPAGEGEAGCHGKTNGVVDLRYNPSAYPGFEHRQKLIEFKADGTVKGRGADLGTCRLGEYNSFDIEYYWDSETDTVELSYAVNGDHRGETTIDATTDGEGNVVESELVHYTLISGDYTLYVDDLKVLATSTSEPTTETPTATDAPTGTATADSPDLSEQKGSVTGNTTSKPDEASGSIPVLNRLGGSGESVSLGLLLGLLGGGGGYVGYRKLASDGESDAGEKEQLYD